MYLVVDQKYWGQLDQVIQRRPGDFNPPYVQAPAIDVEMTSYALLTYVEQRRMSEALPVVKWLLTQRNPEGGFVSTQVYGAPPFIYYTSIKKLILSLCGFYGSTPPCTYNEIAHCTVRTLTVPIPSLDKGRGRL